MRRKSSKLLLLGAVCAASFLVGSFFVQPYLAEASYQAGYKLEALPETAEIPPKFTDDYPDIHSFLEDHGYGEYEVLYDKSPEVNCGMRGHAPESLPSIAGCYRYSYGKHTIIMYWDPDITSEMHGLMEFITLHEVAHAEQNQQHFRLMDSREGELEEVSELLKTVVEVDASCRVVFNHGKEAKLSELTSSPCRVDDWDEDWLIIMDREVRSGKVKDLDKLTGPRESMGEFALKKLRMKVDKERL